MFYFINFQKYNKMNQMITHKNQIFNFNINKIYKTNKITLVFKENL